MNNAKGLILVRVVAAATTIAAVTLAANVLLNISVRQAKFSEAATGATVIRAAISLYAAQTGTYPTIPPGSAFAQWGLDLDAASLDGRFFCSGDYDVLSTAVGYTIIVRGGGPKPEAPPPGTSLLLTDSGQWIRNY